MNASLSSPLVTHAKRTLACVWLLLAGGCALPELASVTPGTCSSAIEANRWPKFVGSEGAAPQYASTDVGWDEGLVPPDFELNDQFGDPMCLWQLVGHYVILDVSALWCGPCQELAKTTTCTQQAYGDELVYATLIIEDLNGEPADQSHAEQWSEAFGLDQGLTPVISDGGQLVSSGFSNPQSATLPTLLLLDSELRWLLRTDSGLAGELEIRNVLDDLTGLNSDACHASEAR